MKRFLVLLSLFLAVACNSYKTTTVVLPDGFEIKAAIADTPQAREKGLMFINDLPENKGMLFVFEEEQLQQFWMKNTFIDLDMVFIGADKKVTSVAAEVPHSYSYTPDNEVAYALGYGQYVLEIPARAAAKHGVIPETALKF
jgi:hypothetical protein